MNNRESNEQSDAAPTPTIESIRVAWRNISDADHTELGDELKEIGEYLGSALFRISAISHSLKRRAHETDAAEAAIGDLGEKLEGAWKVIQQVSLYLYDNAVETRREE